MDWHLLKETMMQIPRVMGRETPTQRVMVTRRLTEIVMEKDWH